MPDSIEKAKTDDSFDQAIDSRQVELARKESCVLASRLAVWILKEADLKVYLDADENVRAQRIFKREGGDLQAIKDFTALRDAEDSGRYKRLYKVKSEPSERLTALFILIKISVPKGTSQSASLRAALCFPIPMTAPGSSESAL